MTRDRTRVRDGVCTALAVLSGCTDAVGFLALGGSFTSVMTGNMVLAGVGVGAHRTHLVVAACAAIAAYVGGVWLGTVVGRGVADRPGDAGTWTPRAARILAVELIAFAVAAALWWAHGSTPEGGLRTALLVLDAIALGCQSSAIASLGVSGLSTTYMTGTLTTMVMGLARGAHPRDAWPQFRLLAGLVLGAVVGALVVRHVPGLAPGLQLLLAGGALAAGIASSRVPDRRIRAGRQL